MYGNHAMNQNARDLLGAVSGQISSYGGDAKYTTSPTPKTTPPARAQMDALQKTVADLMCAIDDLEGRLGSVLPPQPTAAENTRGALASMGGGSPLYCQLVSITDTADALAARVRYIAERIEI